MPKEKSKYTKEQRDAILARANEIGVTNAAEEAGISKWVVFQWRKIMKKKGETVTPLPKKRKSVASTKTSKKTKTSKQTKKISRLADDDTVTSLEFEKAMLKEKIASLTEQVEKLKKALAALA